MSNLDEIIKDLKKINKKTALFSIIAAGVFIAVLGVTIAFISHSLKSMKIEVDGFKFEIEKGIKHIDENLEQLVQIENGNNYRLELKEEAFAIIDDNSIEIENGIDNVEKEKILDNHKYNGFTNIDGDLIDQKGNVEKFNYMWGIEEGFDINTSFDENFDNRLLFTHKQHRYKLPIDYFNQRDTENIGYIICVPSSAVLLFNVLSDIDIEVMQVIDYFSESNDIKNYSRYYFGEWIEKYIKENKLYQITGVFTYGFNLFLQDNFPDFEYEIDFDYWTIPEIADYIETFGIMSATYFPSYVREGTRTGGHMITITKAYYDYEGNLIAFGVNDPFGNPNVAYRGDRGEDGNHVIIDIDTMRTVMKSYRDDHGVGASYLYRILYFKNK